MNCKCFTKNGQPCSRLAIPPSQYCWQHQSCSVKTQNPDTVIKRIGRQRTLNTIKPGVLTVSAYANFFPVCYKEKSQLKGLDVDLMKEFGKLSGLQVVFIEKEKFDGIWLDPVNGISDVAIGGIGMSKKRTTVQTEFSIPYFYVARTLVYNLRDPVKTLKGITNTTRATYNSTGFIDAKLRLQKLGLDHFLQYGKTDQQDLNDLLSGKIQGLFRGSFVGKSIVKQYPQLGMIKPWHIDPSLVTSDGEVFAYPTNKDSGIAVILSMMLTKDIMNKHLKHLVDKYDLE